MDIDRSNYEICLIDWLDGNLNDFQVGQIQLFLMENPDLKEEFDELTTFRLTPSDKSFPNKNKLMKSHASISGYQFEYLCAAYLENDLSAGQKEELKEIIELDTVKKLTFEMIQKMRLSPAPARYKQKKRLIRRTSVHKITHLSLIGLSAAAITIITIITFYSVPQTLPVNSEKTALSITIDKSYEKSVIAKVPDTTRPERKIIPINKQNSSPAVSQKPVARENNSNLSFQSDSVTRLSDKRLIPVIRIPVSAAFDFKEDTNYNTLIASNSRVIIPVYDDGRSKLRKYIARTFREKILKENTTKDSPLKAFEIAEAGVSGLNKLLGWEMELDKKNDENGKPKSVYFSSRILKINAPLKKTEPLQ